VLPAARSDGESQTNNTDTVFQRSMRAGTKLPTTRCRSPTIKAKRGYLYGVYVQAEWKIPRKLDRDYGLGGRDAIDGVIEEASCAALEVVFVPTEKHQR